MASSFLTICNLDFELSDDCKEVRVDDGYNPVAISLDKSEIYSIILQLQAIHAIMKD